MTELSCGFWCLEFLVVTMEVAIFGGKSLSLSCGCFLDFEGVGGLRSEI